MSEKSTGRSCESKGYGRTPCNGPADFDVVYTSGKGSELDRHPACFAHGLAEVERHHSSAGMSRCELVPGPMGSIPPHE